MPVASGIYYYAFQPNRVDSPPVVLIHGAGGTHLYWPAQVRRLTGYYVYALDMPGHGKSNEMGGQQTIAGYARRILDWMDALGLHRAVFIGHSMGGAVALALAIQHAERVLGLGLVDTGARLVVNPQLLEYASRPATCHKAVEAIVAWSFSRQASPRLVELAGQRMNETRASVLHGDLLACDAFDVTERVGEIRLPTLVVCGAEDRMTPLRQSQFLAGAIPSARLEVIPQAGHMAMLEQPQAVANVLRPFIGSIPYHPGKEA